MKKICSHFSVLAFFWFLTIFASGQSVVDSYIERLSKASNPSDIKKVLKTAEKDGLGKVELLDLRYSAYLQVVKLVGDRSLKKELRNSLAGLLIEFEDDLPAELEQYLSEIEVSTPQSRDISRLSVRLAQLLSNISINEISQSKRTKIAEQRREKARQLYGKALAVESKLDPISLDSLALVVVLADEYLAVGEIEKALPLYEEAIAGIEKKEGRTSQFRVRPLFSLAQIADIAGDIERFERLKNELADIGVAYHRSFSLNTRTTGEAKGMRDRGGRILLETTYWPGPTAPPSAPGASKTNILRSSSVNSLPRVERNIDIISKTGSSGHPAIVTVNAEGNVTDVEVILATSPKEKIEKIVKTWQFRPLVYKGKPSQMKGLIYCWIIEN